jgi:hypothetical protein
VPPEQQPAINIKHFAHAYLQIYKHQQQNYSNYYARLDINNIADYVH